jgi:4-hydroxy-2-oxoglutarate aldolase
LIAELAVECPNICGVKLTYVPTHNLHSSLNDSFRCGNVGKLTRIADVVADPAFTPRKNPQAPFLVLGGYADFIVPSTFVKGHGAITGLANVAPVSHASSPAVFVPTPIQYAIVKLFELSEASRNDPSVLPEAQRLQGIIARGDYTLAKASIAGTKFILKRLHGYGGLPRRPLPSLDANAAEDLWNHPHIQALIRLEQEFDGKNA